MTAETTNRKTTTMNASTRVYTVAVFQHDRGEGRAPIISAYTMWFNPTWAGCCLHRVGAESGTAAKKIAISNHREGFGCNSVAVAVE